MLIIDPRIGEYRNHLKVHQYAVSKWLVFALLFFTTTLNASDSKESTSTLLLNDANHHYDVNSAKQASGFYACPEGLKGTNLTTLLNEEINLQTTTLPNFKKNNRYCFFINMVNQTNQLKWNLHFSNFFIDRVDVHLFDGVVLHQYHSDWIAGIGDEKINVLGRAFSLDLKTNKRYLLAVELTADGIVSPPYIALMGKPQYHAWSEWMSHTYNLSVGAIIGLILVALLCSVILKDITFFWFGISSLLLFSFFAVRSHLGIFVLHSTPVLPSWIWLWASATSLSLLFFARAFVLPTFESSSIQRTFDLSIRYLLIVALLSFFLPRSWNLAIYSLNGIIIMVIIFYAGIIRVIEKGRYYLIFMLGWIPVLFSLLEHLAIIVIEPAAFTQTLSYKILREPFYQIAHMLIHFVAMLIRIDALKKEKYHAEMRIEAKSRFLASVSHDLRQPLHSMGMFLAHLDSHIDSKAGKNILAKVYSLHTTMNDSFKTLMELSRLEAGAVKLNTEIVDLRLLIARLRLEFEPHACLKGLKIRFKSNIKKIEIDAELFERILRNLVSNAIKYTDQGGVLVGFRRRKNHMLIQVWDTGCGISADDQRVIFDIYTRSKKVLSNHQGMGIGLAIVKHLVGLLDAEIAVKSKEAKPGQNSTQKIGTVFQIRLPLSKSYNPELDARTDVGNKTGLRIILKLPNTEMHSQVFGSLKNWGYLIAGESQIENGSPMTLIITERDKCLTAETLTEFVSNFEEEYGNVVIAMFCNEVDRELTGKLTALNVHMLSSHYRPAQLRSLIRYLESLLLKNK
jgi:two-component system, sensor histidine kinase